MPLHPTAFSEIGATAPISKQSEKRRFHSVSCEMLATVDGQQDAFPGVGTQAAISTQAEKDRFRLYSRKTALPYAPSELFPGVGATAPISKHPSGKRSVPAV